MSALPLPSAATSCFADKACCADGVGTTLTVRPARRKSPSLMPMYRGASATPGGATTVMVPDAVGPEPADDPVPGNWQPATRIRLMTIAATPAAQRTWWPARPPHRARSGPARSLMTLLGGQGGTVVDTSERTVAPDSTLLAASARHTSVTSRLPSHAGMPVCAPFC